jgi:hypothetical protein
LHQFGHARERYIYAFLVVIVLLITMVVEGYALRTAVREASRTRGARGWLQFVRRTRARRASSGGPTTPERRRRADGPGSRPWRVRQRHWDRRPGPEGRAAGVDAVLD